jgi:hypothetical protein
VVAYAKQITIIHLHLLQKIPALNAEANAKLAIRQGIVYRAKIQQQI